LNILFFRNKDFPEALTALGLFYEYGKGGVLKDVPKATELYRRASDLGDKQARQRLMALGP